MILVQVNESTAARRTVMFQLVDATDGITPETGEAGGQPQISVNGGAWTNTGIGVLSSIGNGRYTAILTQAIVQSAGTLIRTRYKSANTAECPGESVQVVGFDPTTDWATEDEISAVVEALEVDGVPLLISLAAIMAVLLNVADPSSTGVNFRNRADTADLVEILLGTTRGERTTSTINEEAVG